MPLSRLQPRRVGRALLVLVCVVALAGCQVKVLVDTTVEPDGSGTITVSVGLDAAALSQVGDLSSQLRVGDLEAAGWKVTGPARAADGYTWVRASKPFADPGQATAVMNEVNGADGAFRDWHVSHSSSLWSTDWKVQGTVDLRKGMQTFSDPKLNQALGANGYDSMISQIEKREGRPISDMVDVRVSVELPGAAKVYAPKLADGQTTAVAVTHTKVSPAVGVAVVIAAAVLAALALVVLRRRFVRHHRRYQARH